MEATNVLAESGKFEEGRQLLEQSRTLLRMRNHLRNSIGCEELQADLTECMSGMVDRHTKSYNSHGNKSMSNYSGAAHRERSCAFRVERSVSYQSPTKAMMCQQAAIFMEQDEDLEEENTHSIWKPSFTFFDDGHYDCHHDTLTCNTTTSRVV